MALNIYPDQVALLYRQAPFAHVMTLLSGVIVCVALATSVPLILLWSWLSALVLITSAHAWLTLRYRQQRPGNEAARYWGKRYIMGSALAGGLWGLIALLPFSSQAPLELAFVAVVLAGMSAATIVLFASLKQAAVAFILPASLPLAIRFFWHGEPLTIALGCLTILFLLCLLAATWINHGLITDVLRLRTENQTLSQETLADKLALPKINAELHSYLQTHIHLLTERSSLETQLRQALRGDQLSLYFQPLYDVTTNTTIGFEALLRWQHPQYGLLTGGEIIPLAEKSDLILAIDAWVLRNACLQAARWQQPENTSYCIAVNLSAAYFSRPTLPQQISELLSETGLPADRLKLELTESQKLGPEEDHIILNLIALKGLGIEVAIDDFGTGYASLDYLKRLPVDWLKIDRTFIQDVIANADHAAIVSTIITLANRLNLKIVVEGVETQQQLAFIKAHGCCTVQGWYIGRPIPAQQMTHNLAKDFDLSMAK